MEHAKALFEILKDETDAELKEHKLSVSIYAKSFYRNIYNIGLKRMSKETSLQHISMLFDAMSSVTLNLKAKFSLVQGLEQMLQLYILKETDNTQLREKMGAMVESIQQLQLQGQQQGGNPELIKSCFMLVEVMFAMQKPELQQIMFNDCVTKLELLIKSLLEQLATDIMALSNSLQQDASLLNAESP